LLKKGQVCTAHVKVKLLSESYTTASRLCIKLDPCEHFWRITSKEEDLFLELSNDVIEWSRDVELMCDASGSVNYPSVVLCVVDNVHKSEGTGTTEVVTPFQVGEVDYLSAGLMVSIEDIHQASEV